MAVLACAGGAFVFEHTPYQSMSNFLVPLFLFIVIYLYLALTVSVKNINAITQYHVGTQAVMSI
jgi:hypothetical protein